MIVRHATGELATRMMVTNLYDSHRTVHEKPHPMMKAGGHGRLKLEGHADQGNSESRL